MAEDKIMHTLCRMCDDHCGLNVHVKEGKIVDIEGNKEHIWNKGRLCIKAKAGMDMIYSKERILKPLKRTADGWIEIELEVALDEITEKINQIKNKYGERSMSIWKGEALGFSRQEALARRFIHAFGSPNYFSNDSQCYVGRYIGYSTVAGMWQSQPDFINSKCIVIWGSNPPNSHPNMIQDIMYAKKNGAKLICIDTRLSTIGMKADIFAQIKPGTDGALAHGITNYLIKNNCINEEFIKEYTVGFDELSEYVKSFTPEYVNCETGLDKKILTEIAQTIAKNAPNVVNYVGNGLEHHENGTNNIRAVACIDGVLGSIDAKGGNVISEGFGLKDLTLYDELPLEHLNPIGAKRFPMLYHYRKECHTMSAMDTILSAEPYPLKGMIITGANPVLTNPNSNKVIKALENLDLLVVRDLFMTETANLAHYILPAASYFERSEFHCHIGKQAIGLTQRIFTIPQVQDEYMFFHDLAHRLGFGEYFPWSNEDELNKWLIEPTGISIEEIKNNPQGYNYKKRIYEKYKHGFKFNTESGKIEFISRELEKYGYARLPKYVSPSYIANPCKEYQYTMITGARKLIYNHGRNRNINKFKKLIPKPEVEIHKEDAKSLGLMNGDIAMITSKIGSIKVPVKIVDNNEIVRGVIQITHGWKDANVNILTHDDVFDDIDGFPLMKAVSVKVEK